MGRDTRGRVPRRRLIGLTLIPLWLTAPAADAHPHVWARIKVEVVFGADGRPASIRHIWIFDEMFSTFSVSGIGNGKPTREELAPLAKRYVSSLKSYNYFTQAAVDGKETRLGEPAAYALDFHNGTLELQFTLPFVDAARRGALTLAIYDPSYFVALSLAEGDAARLIDAPANCTISANAPKQPKAVDESFFQSLKADQDWAAQFASSIAVTCR